MDIPLYFQILLGQWEAVILGIQYEGFRVFSPFLALKKSCQGGTPLNVYPNKRSMILCGKLGAL